MIWDVWGWDEPMARDARGGVTETPHRLGWGQRTPHGQVWTLGGGQVMMRGVGLAQRPALLSPAVSPWPR